jgi:hypothetical protein
MHAFMYICMNECSYVCMFVRMYVRTYVCMYVCVVGQVLQKESDEAGKNQASVCKEQEVNLKKFQKEKERLEADLTCCENNRKQLRVDLTSLLKQHEQLQADLTSCIFVRMFLCHDSMAVYACTYVCMCKEYK